jgi:hypothetical protein
MRNLMKWLLALTLGSLASTPKAWAYPQFIAFGYTSCAVCHYNPLGGGPLTDYGRALGATEFSSTWSSKVSNEEIALNSGFLGSKSHNLGKYLRPSFDYRGLGFYGDLAGTPVKKWVNMQADFNVVALTPGRKTYFSATLGYIPSESEQNWISREHYVAYRPNKQWGFYTGMMDVAYGTRIPDHTSVVRGGGDLGLGQNDQVHGVMIHRVFTDEELVAHVFLGNMFQEASKRQKGLSLFYEYDAGPKARLGTSILYSQSASRKRGLFSVHSREAIKGGASLLAEGGITYNHQTGLEADVGAYGFLQTFLKLRRGLHYFMTFEYLTRSDVGDRYHRIQGGPGLTYSPIQRVEFRTEILAYRTIAGTPDSTTLDNLNFLGQLHVYF